MSTMNLLCEAIILLVQAWNSCFLKIHASIAKLHTPSHQFTPIDEFHWAMYTLMRERERASEPESMRAFSCACLLVPMCVHVHAFPYTYPHTLMCLCLCMYKQKVFLPSDHSPFCPPFDSLWLTDSPSFLPVTYHRCACVCCVYANTCSYCRVRVFVWLCLVWWKLKI